MNPTPSILSGNGALRPTSDAPRTTLWAVSLPPPCCTTTNSSRAATW